MPLIKQLCWNMWCWCGYNWKSDSWWGSHKDSSSSAEWEQQSYLWSFKSYSDLSIFSFNSSNQFQMQNYVTNPFGWYYVFLLNYKVKIFNTFYIYLYIFICICLSSHKGQYVQVRNNLCKSILLFCYVWLRDEIQVNRERYCADPNWSILLQKKKDTYKPLASKTSCFSIWPLYLVFMPKMWAKPTKILLSVSNGSDLLP